MAALPTTDMCGIAGFVGGGSAEQLGKMSASIAHRGPDDEDAVLERGIGFAHARLAIIDLSQAGHQPMWNDDRSMAITFNGEIYNFEILKEELKKDGTVFRSNSDTEVIVRLYERDGAGCFEKLVGMFAIALFDFTKRRLVLARDRMGEKPLYWSLQKEALVFASELSALAVSGFISKELDLVSLNKYLLFDCVPTPATLFAGVYKLEPGTALVYENGVVSKKFFWHPPTEIFHGSEEEALSRLDTLMHESVEGELVSDAPLGVSLSGGIDSSTVAWYAREHSKENISTFSIGFGNRDFDESLYARDVAAFLGTSHHERLVTSHEALDVIPNIADVLSEPVADASIIPTLLLSQFTRQSVTVSLGGDGADELFAGYPTFQAERVFNVYRRLPKAVRVLNRSIINTLPAGEGNFNLSFNLKKFVSSENEEREYRHLEWLGSFPEKNRQALSAGPLSPIASGDGVFEDVERYMNEYRQPDIMNRLLYVYARLYLMDQVLVKVDRASMHYALETRAPFLDHRLVEFVFSLPFDFKYKQGTTKYLLKKLMRGRLPDRTLERKKKGFGVPLAAWLKGPLKELCEDLLSQRQLNRHGLFDPAVVAKLKTDHYAGRTDNRKQLWNLMVFQMWYNRWMQ